MKLTPAQQLVGKWLEEWGYEPVYEYRFDETRRWRADIAIPEVRVLIELNGHYQGRHGAGWSSDSEKANHAQMQGWKILAFSNRDVLRGACAYAFLSEHLAPVEHRAKAPTD